MADNTFVIRRCARLLHAGGVIAYPTEGVYGLGCLPDNKTAVERILAIKGRSPSAGLILLASHAALLEAWIDPTPVERQRLLSACSYPTTWIVSARSTAPDWVTGGRRTLAVRISSHPLASALSHAAGSALVSTSANRHGKPPARSRLQVQLQMGQELDGVLGGAVGNATGPSEIRVAQDNRVLRPAS